MPTKKPFVKAYLSREEYTQVCDLADRSGLSRSEFVRRVCLAKEIHSLVDQKAVLALIKSNADLGRLGGLLKQHLVTEEAPQDELRRLLRSIESTRRELAAGMKEVTRRLLSRRKP